MDRRPPLEVSLSAREVVAAGEPFRPWDRTFSDADVALDEISDLRASQEPLVLRVAVAGGLKGERELVEGDWLCDDDGSQPRRIPQPNWGYERSARRWSLGRTWLDAWEQCPSAQWSLHAAVCAGVDRRLVVLASCACARTALQYVPEGEERHRRAIEAAEAWARAKGTAAKAAAAAHAAAVAADTAYSASTSDAHAAYHYAALAAYYASVTVASAFDASDADYAASAASAAYSAAAAVAAVTDVDADVSSAAALREMAGVVRLHVPTIAVLRAVAFTG